MNWAPRWRGLQRGRVGEHIKEHADAKVDLNRKPTTRNDHTTLKVMAKQSAPAALLASFLMGGHAETREELKWT